MEKKFFFVGTFLLVIVLFSCFLFCGRSNKKNFKIKSLGEEYKLKNIDLKNYENNLIGVAIIGCGPAGCSAALKTSRMGVPTVVFGIGEGQLGTTGYVENIPGVPILKGPQIVKNMKEQAAKYGALFVEENIEKIEEKWPFKITLSSGEVFYALAVIIATGSVPKKLNIKGEEEYWGKGVSSCAICDGPFYQKKDVIVVGGGDSACEEALQLIDAGVKSVTIFVRSDKMRASEIMKKYVEKSTKIKIVYNIEIEEIVGDGKSVKLVKCKKHKDLEFETIEMPIDGVFIAIGHHPNTKLFKNMVFLENDLIMCLDRSQKTTHPGIFAAGDVTNNYRQADISIGEGGKAAIDAYNFLKEVGFDSSIIKEFEKSWVKIDKSGVNYKKNEIVCDDGICKITSDETQKEIFYENKYLKSNKVQNLKKLKDFEKIISKDNPEPEYILLQIFMDGCPPCNALKGVLAKYALLDDGLEVYTMNYKTGIMNYRNGKNNDKFYSQSFPYTLILKRYDHKCEVVSTHLGFMDLKELKKWIKSAINK